MPSQTLKLFYKANKLSTLYTGTIYQTVLSANNQNLSETTSLLSQARLLATDAQESTVNTVSESQTTITYSPYGNDSCPPANPLLSRFTGQSWLPSAIGYLLGNGHRLFNPGLMRFHSADSFSPFGSGGLNTYAYCGNDPINRVDPSGRFFGKLFKRMGHGYSYSKLAPRLKNAEPNFSRNEYQALSTSIEKRQLRAERKIALGLEIKGSNTVANGLHETDVLKRQRSQMSKLSVDKNSRYNFDTSSLTQELHGHIPVHAGPTSKLAEKILSSPTTIDPSIPEDVVHQELLERLRRLRED